VNLNVKISWDDDDLCWCSECESIGLYLCDYSYKALLAQNKEIVEDLMEHGEIKKDVVEYIFTFTEPLVRCA
jgi:hypothetical protein